MKKDTIKELSNRYKVLETLLMKTPVSKLNNCYVTFI